MTTRTPHVHERWQMRVAPDGSLYCAACGATIPGAQTTLDDGTVITSYGAKL